MSDAIEIRDLTKRFGSTTALSGLTMSVGTSQVHGFLGPNGSGKSTTIRVLLGLLHSDAGSVRLLGGNPWTQAPELHRRLAYVPGDVNLWPNLTGGEAIDVICRARGPVDTNRRNELIEKFQLDPRKKGRSYSKGNRQKVALIAALACDVELYLLDEPTSGLDPLMERVFREEIRTLARAGRTVLLSSHILSEVEALCDRVSIVKAGRIVESNSLADLRHLHRTEVVAHLLPEQAPQLAAIGGVRDPRLEGSRWVAQVDDAALPTLMQALGQLKITSVTMNPPSLEELFLDHYDTIEPLASDR